ncbi:MAG: NTP transferase domain-containing protein [Gammaproteobacteria bacterium]
MKVIILAAGIGNRLGDKDNGKPKCLLEFGGRSLLQRQLLLLSRYPLSEILIVTGYRRDAITEELAKVTYEIPVRTVYNPDFRAGSVVSLWCSRDTLLSGHDIILMDADVLSDPRIMQALFGTEAENCFLLDREFEPGDEPVKLCVRDGKLIDFRKQIDQNLRFDFQGESVGFFRFSATASAKLAKRTQSYIDNKRINEPYEEAIRDLLLAKPGEFAYADITGLAWIEIDFPEDIERAEQEILKKIDHQED